MKEINWKFLSYSLIVSTIVNGAVLSLFVIQYIDSVTVVFHGIISQMNASNTSGGVPTTIAIATPAPVWVGIVIFSLSYIGITLVSYYVLQALNQRKK